MYIIAIQISLKSVSKSPTDNKPVLAQLMAWRRTGNKPLYEPMMTLFTDACMSCSVEMSQRLMKAL